MDIVETALYEVKTDKGTINMKGIFLKQALRGGEMVIKTWKRIG